MGGEAILKEVNTLGMTCTHVHVHVITGMYMYMIVWDTTAHVEYYNNIHIAMCQCSISTCTCAVRTFILCVVQRRELVTVGDSRVCPSGQQQLHSLSLAPQSSHVEWSEAVVILRVDPGPVLHQQLQDGRGVAVGC